MRLLYFICFCSSLIFSQEDSKRIENESLSIKKTPQLFKKYRMTELEVPGRTVTYYERVSDNQPFLTWDHLYTVLSLTKMYRKF